MHNVKAPLTTPVEAGACKEIFMMKVMKAVCCGLVLAYSIPGHTESYVDRVSVGDVRMRAYTSPAEIAELFARGDNDLKPLMPGGNPFTHRTPRCFRRFVSDIDSGVLDFTVERVRSYVMAGFRVSKITVSSRVLESELPAAAGYVKLSFELQDTNGNVAGGGDYVCSLPVP